MKIYPLNFESLKRVWFHLVGIVCLIWFLVRVLPAPHRIRYPCQQMSVAVAMGYIGFCSVLFHGFGLWVKRVKFKIAVIIPVLLAFFIIFFSVSGPFFPSNNYYLSSATERWDPIPKEPMGTPKGVNPGGVVWVWNPDATDWDGYSNYWWYEQYTDQDVIDLMFSDGIQALAGTNSDYSAWDSLFTHFNQEHGYGYVGYQLGEKIAIKINLNSNFGDSYTYESNYIDANPWAVKALLKQLVNVVGVEQEDITVYDASRKIANWFYNRVSDEFPDVVYADKNGGASGRTKIVASSTNIHFSNGLSFPLPTVVSNAKYHINMPCTKHHIGPRVTLAGKNFFGSWNWNVDPVHSYLFSGEAQMGNPAPQTDLFAHEDLGKKTLLVFADGTYGCRDSNGPITRFQMYPFNDDWLSSLFFSQDSVAVDSVMYDFLLEEGTGPNGAGPTEGAQNYLHQAAVPPYGVYDPEGDGTYLSESLGVHEHWDTTVDIFSSDRYSGSAGDGIDYSTINQGELKADADGPYYGLINQSVQFNGSATGGNTPYTWFWDFGDGNTSDEQNPTHNYTYPGNFTINLTVSDDSDNLSNDYTWALIQESNHPPDTPSIYGTNKGGVGKEYMYTFIATDPDGNDIWYHISWGDTEIIYIYGPYNSGENITLPHTWSEKGNYSIKCKAQDVYGTESDWATFEVTMPIKISMYIYNFVKKLLENFPYVFPFLRQFFGL